MPQVPTTRGIKIRSAADAHLIFYAVHLGKLPIISRRLDATERQEVGSGAVFVWEERGASTTTANPPTTVNGGTGDDGAGISPSLSGIERWTDGLKWGPSRVRDDFLFYMEKEVGERDTPLTPPPSHHHSPPRQRHSDRLIKQTYSVHYHPQVERGLPPTEAGARKWHLTAYHSASTLEKLADVTSVPELQGITPPEGLFKKARVGKKREGASNNPPPSHHSSHSTSSAHAHHHHHHPPSGNTHHQSHASAPLVHPSPAYPKPPTANNVGYGASNYGPSMNGIAASYGYDPASQHPHHHHHHPGSYSTPSHLQSEPNGQRYLSHEHHHAQSYSGRPSTGGGDPFAPPPPSNHSHSYSQGGYGDSYYSGGHFASNPTAGESGPVTSSDYDPFRPPSSHSHIQQSPHPSHIQPSPALHQRSQSHGYPQGTPVVHHTHPMPIPGQQHDHQRNYSIASDMNGGNSIRSPGSGVIRNRRGLNMGSEEGKREGALSTSPPVDGVGRGHFSPYSRPSTIQGPRSHPAFAPPPNRPSTGYSGEYASSFIGGAPTGASAPYQPPGMPIAHSRSQSVPHGHHYSVPVIPPPPAVPSLYSTPPQNGSSTHYTASTNQPFRQVDYTTPAPQNTWPHSHPHAALPPPSIPPLPTQTSFPYQPPQQASYSSQQDQGGIVPPAPYGAPHLNPDDSPPMPHFRSSSAVYGLVNAGVSNPEAIKSTETSLGEVNNASHVNETYSATGKKPRIASMPPALDTSVASTSSGPTSASSKLVPLTPSAHHSRDPEDERLLVLISKGGKGSGDAGSASGLGGEEE